MITESTVTNLQRLTKGRNKLDKEALQLLITEVKATPIDEVLAVVFPTKAPKKRTTAKPKPEWLEAMLSARKKLSWSAAEATRTLFEIAEDNGLSLTKAKQKSFPKAAEQIAEQFGGDKTRDLFVAWVTEFADSHQMA